MHWGDTKKELFSKKLLERLREERNYEYAYKDELSMKGKFSVSELKKYENSEVVEDTVDEEMSWEDFCGMYDDITDNNEELIVSDIDKEFIPEFIRGKDTEIKANERGNAYHKVMEILDYDKVNTETDIKKQLEIFMNAGYLTKEQYDSVSWKDIYNFVNSSLGRRIKKAKENQLAMCEQPFVIGIPAKELFAGKFDTTSDSLTGNDNILIQGIIDLYFEEDDGIVLVDYKTDKVNAYNGEEILKERYYKQLDLYKDALERMTGKKVKEKIIYSFSLGKEILL